MSERKYLPTLSELVDSVIEFALKHPYPCLALLILLKMMGWLKMFLIILKA